MKHIGAQATERLSVVENSPGIIDAMKRDLAHQLAEVMLSEGLILFSPATTEDQFGTIYHLNAEALVGQPKRKG